MQDFKLCLMAAGRGTRNNRFANLHKALLPLANRPVISYILDCIDPSTEVVIALGHLQDQLRSYLEYTHPHANFTFVEVDNYDGPGAGPGYSLLQCREHLDTPFVFTSIDTLFNTKLECPETNWLGVATRSRSELQGYCLVDVGPNKRVRKLYYDPEECLGNEVFIGIAGVRDHETFWTNLADKRTINNEHQVINGFSDLDLVAETFNWYDTGTDDRYRDTLKHFPRPITTPKLDETLYIDHGKVVKFFSDSTIADRRCQRAASLKATPKITRLSSHTYGYEYVLGNLLSHTYDERILDKFIEFCHEFFTESTDTTVEFYAACEKMYRAKTHERVESLAGTEIDIIERVNGVKVAPIQRLLMCVDWDKINDMAIPFVFHGDFQPENIVMDWENVTLLDWRDSFGNSTEVGDLYYDLAKLHHALVVNGTNIIDGKYSLEIHGVNAFVNIDSRHNLLLLQEKLRIFCISQDYDWEHVELLSALQYITIANLYEDIKYREFLFLFGKLCLTKCLRK